MPVVKVNYDKDVVEQAEAQDLCHAAQKIVKAATGIEATFVYGNHAHITIDVPPIEVHVEISDYKITDEEALLKRLSEALRGWKQENSFPHPINLVLIPMHWNIEFNI